MKRFLTALLCLGMLLSLLPCGVLAVDAGDRYVADAASWGSQNNNGWYYMYRDADGVYHEMNYYTESTIDWQAGNFASDPNATGEMFFITQNTAFVGELGSRPVLAFRAPTAGQIQLTTQTHSTEQMHMQVYVGDTLQKIGGQDSLTLTTTGTLPGAMTQTDLLLDVAKGQMVYVEFYSTDITVQRQVWFNEYSVEYISVTEDLTGATFAPNMEAWGTQGNNGWYYMYRNADGLFKEMNYYDAISTIAWQQNAFASDVYTLLEMFFINQTSFFTGEAGSNPVYAFKAPVGGEIKLRFETHGSSQMYAQVLVNEDVQNIGDSDRVVFSTDGPLEGYTATELTLNVKKNTMVYIIGCTSGTDRQGWLRNYSVEYLSTNDQVDYTATAYTPDLSRWGSQGNNGWYYMFKHGSTGIYGLLDYYDSTASIDWQRDRYAFDPAAMNEMLFIEKEHYFTGELGSNPVYAFKAPISGQLEVYFEIHGLQAMGVSAYVEDTLVQIQGKDRYTFTTSGTLPGAFTAVSFTCDVVAGDMVYLVCSSTDASIRDGWFRNPSAKYLSTSDQQPDTPIEEEDPMVEGTALEWNQSKDYYEQLQQRLASDEPMTWLFVGASNTANDKEYAKGYRNYSEIFEAYLKGTLGRVNDQVVNTAVSGWKISHIDYERDIAAFDPDVVFVVPSSNDSFITDFAADKVAAELVILYQKIIDGGAIPVIEAVISWSSRRLVVEPERGAGFMERYPEVIRKVAYQLDLLFVDNFTMYLGDQDYADGHYYAPDFVHINRVGELFSAQNLIRDLGLDQDSAIMNQDTHEMDACEVAEKMIVSTVPMEDYLTDGTACSFSNVDLDYGIVLVGGIDAIGSDESMITNRSISQYLSNNCLRGRKATYYCSLQDALAFDQTDLGAGRALLLLPEAYGINGEALWVGATAQQILAVANKAAEAGSPVVLITPAPTFAALTEETEALAQAVRDAAAAGGYPLIDLFGYFTAVYAQDADMAEVWYNGTALNFAGANDAAMLIGSALGLDPMDYSDNRIDEDFTEEGWGIQGSNGFYYLYEDKATGQLAQLPFIPMEETNTTWMMDRYSLADYEYTFIGQDSFHAGNNYNPVKAFQVPYSGTIYVWLKHARGTADASEGGTLGSMYITARVNDTPVQIDGQDKVVMLLNNNVHQISGFEVKVEAGDWIYVTVEADSAAEGILMERVICTALEETVEACTHESTEIRDAVDATCTAPGYTGDTYCTVCGEKVADGEAVEALGHSYEDGVCTVCGGEDPNALPDNPFEDVKESDYFYTPVLWAVKKGVTTGTTPTTFSPNDPCTRGQIVTFLWRAFGSPEPTSTVNPFTDVSENMYYYKAVLWAVEQGITNGVSSTEFGPEETCTRGQVATFLWRACGKPVPQSSENPFSDVSESVYYYEPILWAVENGVTNGTGGGKFSPEESCTRGQIVTFLYRALAE